MFKRKEHPGAAKLPSPVVDCAHAKEAISVWVIPGENCAECDEFHEDRRFMAGDTDSIPVEAMGDMLGQIAEQHAHFTGHDDASRQKSLARIVKDFMERYDKGSTKH